MEKDVANKVLKKKEKKVISPVEKIWCSITKFEKYPEMAAEGTPRAFLYLLFLSLLVSIIIGIGITIQFNKMINSNIKFFEENVTNIKYENGELQVETKENNVVETEYGTIIVDTNDIDDKKKSEYYAKIPSNKVSIIWLKNEVQLKIKEGTIKIEYKEISDKVDAQNINKESVLNILNEYVNKFEVYVFFFTSQGVVEFVLFFIYTLSHILILSLFGVLTATIIKISLRYRAIFNMATYAITLPTILQTIYKIVYSYTGFEIKSFDMMYTAISYICLTAAIFMIRSDVIKQQIELIRYREEKENQEKSEEEKNEEIKKEEEQKNHKRQEEEQEEKIKKESENEENKDEKQGEITGESEGSNA